MQQQRTLDICFLIDSTSSMRYSNKNPGVALWPLFRATIEGLSSAAPGLLAEIKAQHRRFVLRFDTAQLKPPAVPGALSVTGSGKEWSLLCNGARTELPAIAANLGLTLKVDEGSDYGANQGRVFADDHDGPAGAGPARAVEVRDPATRDGHYPARRRHS